MKTGRIRAGICATAFLLIFTAGSAYAAGADWYLQNGDILCCNDMARSALRAILWAITKILVDVANACESLYDTAFGFIDITSSKTINSFISAYKPAFAALMALSILYLGILLIMQHEKKPKIGINIALCVLCVCCSTFLFQQMNTLAHSFKDGIGAATKAEKMAYETVDSHMADLVRLNEIHSSKGLGAVNWKKKKEYGAGIKGEKTINAVDFTEVLNYKSSKYTWHGDTEDILKHKVITKYSGSRPEYDTAEISNGWFWNNADDTDLGNEFYYRYTFDFLSAWMEILALMIIYICMSYKCVRVAYELVVARLLAYLYSAELSGGEKIRKILVFIRDSYILLVVTAICIRVYLLINSYLQGQTQIHGIPKGMIMLFVAFSVIDGPNLVEKLLGMDAGLKSSTARMLAIGRIGLGAAHAASPKGIAGAVNNIRSGRISRGGIMAGAVGATVGVMNEQTGTREGGIFKRGGGTPDPKPAGGGNTQTGGTNTGTPGGRGTEHAPGGNRTGSTDGARNAAAGTSGAPTGSGRQHGDSAAGVGAGNGTQQRGERGPRGERGSRGENGRDGQDGPSFMNEPAGSYQASRGDYSFMDAHRTEQGAGRRSTDSSLPQRQTTARSHTLDQKKRGEH